MDVLFRHTIIGESIRLIDSSRLPYADELDPAVLKNLVTLQRARQIPEHADENSALLAEGENAYGSGTLLVNWYDVDDSEVRPMLCILDTVLTIDRTR